MKMKIGLPKGRFHEKSVNIIQNNCKLDGFRENKLVYESSKCLFFLLKTQDICSLLMSKHIDVGIVSDEWILEYEIKHNIKFTCLKKLPWINTRMSLISENDQSIHTECSVASSFPSISQRYLEKKGISNNANYNIHSLSGSIEATVPNMFSFGIDCVESGKTIQDNNLKEIDVIYDNLGMSIITANNLFDHKMINNILSMNND